jgi:organic hydroperoxide reductase OsmC/OhrA
VAAGPSVHRVERLVHLAHDECYIANSLATPVTVEPVVTFSM